MRTGTRRKSINMLHPTAVWVGKGWLLLIFTETTTIPSLGRAKFQLGNTALQRIRKLTDEQCLLKRVLPHTTPKTYYPHLNCALIHCLVSIKLDYMSMSINKFNDTSLIHTHFHVRRQIAAALL